MGLSCQKGWHSLLRKRRKRRGIRRFCPSVSELRTDAPKKSQPLSPDWTGSEFFAKFDGMTLPSGAEDRKSDRIRRAFEEAATTPQELGAGNWDAPGVEEIDALFPDYTVVELIGRGGMGAVFKAVQTSLERDVAIKLLPPELAASDPEFSARFEREAKSMAALDHPNIVHVFDFGRLDDGSCYIIMEYVGGTDFHRMLSAGVVDVATALDVVSQICHALEYAHGKGYVHRDIKPANIFINEEGILKVGDFGLAKVMAAAQPPVGQPTLTRTDVYLGTPAYSAPEQLSGAAVDQRADIYSLGVMFYEMLTGERPVGRFPSPSKKNLQIDVRVDSVVLKALENQPDLRYSTAGELRTEVDELRSHPPAALRPGRIVFAAAVVLALAAVAGLIWIALSQKTKPSQPPGEEEGGSSMSQPNGNATPSGEWVDVLLHTPDLEAHARAGNWIRDADGTLRNNSEVDAIFILPFERVHTYQIEVEVERLSPNQSYGIGFALTVSDRESALHMGTSPGPPPRDVIETDGKKKTSGSSIAPKTYFPVNEKVRLRVEVRKLVGGDIKVEALTDGIPGVVWQGDPEVFYSDDKPHYELPDDRVASVFIESGKRGGVEYRIHQLRFRRLPDEAVD